MKVELLSLSPDWSSAELTARCCYCRHFMACESVIALRGALALHLMDAHHVQVLFGGQGPYTTLSAERERLRRERARAAA